MVIGGNEQWCMGLGYTGQGTLLEVIGGSEQWLYRAHKKKPDIMLGIV